MQHTSGSWSSSKIHEFSEKNCDVELWICSRSLHTKFSKISQLQVLWSVCGGWRSVVCWWFLRCWLDRSRRYREHPATSSAAHHFLPCRKLLSSSFWCISLVRESRIPHSGLWRMWTSPSSAVADLLPRPWLEDVRHHLSSEQSGEGDCVMGIPSSEVSLSR